MRGSNGAHTHTKNDGSNYDARTISATHTEASEIPIIRFENRIRSLIARVIMKQGVGFVCRGKQAAISRQEYLRSS